MAFHRMELAGADNMDQKPEAVSFREKANQTPYKHFCLSCLLDPRCQEWSRWEASDIDGKTREGESLGKRRINRCPCCFDRFGFYSKV